MGDCGVYVDTICEGNTHTTENVGDRIDLPQKRAGAASFWREQSTLSFLEALACFGRLEVVSGLSFVVIRVLQVGLGRIVRATVRRRNPAATSEA